MLLKYREYINTIYESKSFSKAAELLYISQPALSAIVKKVEEEIGTPIFNRSAHTITLTEAGEYYIHAIAQVMEIEQDMKAHFSALVSQAKGNVTVGASSFFCTHILPPLIAEFEASYPGCRVTTIEANTDDLKKCLRAGTIDLNIDVDKLDPALFSARHWGEEHIILAVPSSFSVNEGLKEYQLTKKQIVTGEYLDDKFLPVSLSAFSNEPFLFLKKGNDLYYRGMKMCKNAGFIPRITIHLDQLLTSYYIAKGGRGICFLRATLLAYTEDTDSLCFYKIDDELSKRNIYIYSKKAATLSDIAKSFISFLSM